MGCTSFLCHDFADQQYGMLSSPNMKDVHDANLSFWSPQPYFIAGFFFPQQLFQLAWLYRLWKMDPTKSAKDKAETQIMVDFGPYYAVGNLCIASMLSLFESFGDMMLMSYSLDGVLECLSSEDSKRICAHQFLHATLLHLWPSATNEHSLHILRTHTHCFEDFLRVLEFWTSCTMARSRISIIRARIQW